MKSNFILKFRPPRIAMALFVFFALIHFAIYGLPSPNIASLAIGTIFFASGFIIMMSAWSLFKKKDTALCPTGSASRFIQEGPYRLSRNPMYLGMLVILASSAIALNSCILSLAPLIFFAIIQLVFIPFEENRMEELFDHQYTAYRQKVRRWI